MAQDHGLAVGVAGLGMRAFWSEHQAVQVGGSGPRTPVELECKAAEVPNDERWETPAPLSSGDRIRNSTSRRWVRFPPSARGHNKKSRYEQPPRAAYTSSQPISVRLNQYLKLGGLLVSYGGRREKMRSAFRGLALMVVFIWAIAFLAFRVAGFLIHLFLLLAAIFFVMHFAMSWRTS